MEVSARATRFDDLILWRDMYRLEMGCQITHDSIHVRPGWTQEYSLFLGGTAVGYGSVAVGGPWSGKAAVYEFYVAPHQPRLRVFELFHALLVASRAVSIEVQSKLVPGQRVKARIGKVYGRNHALKVVRAAMADYNDNFAV